ncbi:MAG: helix-turn-helix domain-containing protein [Haloarculaceae archaeon]
MPEGIHTVVEVRCPDACDVVDLSREATVTGVSRSGTPSPDGSVTQEVTVERADLDGDVDLPDGAESVFEYDGSTVYRFPRPRGGGCPCEVVERHDCPVRSMEVEGGATRLAFIADDVGTVREVVGDLRSAFEGVELRHLTQSPPPDDETELLFVDGAALTDRQREVLETAHGMGYFDYPKEANAGEVASALGVTTATFVEHLSAAQSKLLDALLDA